jgi:hypothetical protein
MPSGSALDVSAPNAFNQGVFGLTNVQEAEWLVTSSKDGRILSVQRGAASEAGFMLRHAEKIRWGGRVVAVAGFGVSAYRIATAAPEEQGQVIAEEAGGQLGGMAGTGLAVAGCVLFGVASGGVGLFLCGLAGGIVGGVGGSIVGGAMAQSGGSKRADEDCPNCHDAPRGRSGSGLSLTALEALGAPRGALTSGDIEMLRKWLAGQAPEAGRPGPLSAEDREFMLRWLDSLPPR